MTTNYGERPGMEAQDFYAAASGHLGAMRAYHDAAKVMMAAGQFSDAETMLDKAKAELDAMLAEMRTMNEARAALAQASQRGAS